MARRRPPQLARPHLDGERYLLERRGAALPGDLRRTGEARARVEPAVPAVRPVLAGSWLDGTAAGRLARILADLGFVDDRSDLGEVVGYLPITGGVLRGLLGVAAGIRSTGASPSVAAGAAAGTGPAAPTVEGTDRAGFLTVSTGTSPTTGTLATVTFATAKADDDYAVLLIPAGSQSIADVAKVRATNRLTTGWVLNVPTTALAPSATYTYYYLVEAYEP